MNSSPISTSSFRESSRLGLPDLALVGKAGSGKTTGARLLQQLGYQRVSFAEPLKDVAAMIWGESARTDRGKLQHMGVGVRQVDPNAWVNLLLRRLDESADDSPVVIDDCRFPNEYWALTSRGFLIVRVSAPRFMRIDRLKRIGKFQTEDQLEHESETAIDDLPADHTFTNDSAEWEFYDWLGAIVTREAKKR